MDELHKDGSSPDAVHVHTIDFTYFPTHWHYDGRTSKHGASHGRCRLCAVAWQLLELLYRRLSEPVQHDAR